jgi:hypothetical protein
MNVKTGKKIAYPDRQLTAQERGQIAFRRRIKDAINRGYKFKSFITFTYDPKYYPNASSKDISDFVNRMTRYYRERGINVSYVWKLGGRGRIW